MEKLWQIKVENDCYLKKLEDKKCKPEEGKDEQQPKSFEKDGKSK